MTDRKLRLVPPLPKEGATIRAPVDGAQRAPLLKWTEPLHSRQATKRDLCDILKGLGFAPVVYEWTVPELRRAIRIELERQARSSAEQRSKRQAEREEEARRTGVCPLCRNKATGFFRLPDGRLTWACLEGCNP